MALEDSVWDKSSCARGVTFDGTACPSHSPGAALKLQALVYDILPPTIAIVDYAIGLEKLSANELFSMMLKRHHGSVGL